MNADRHGSGKVPAAEALRSQGQRVYPCSSVAYFEPDNPLKLSAGCQDFLPRAACAAASRATGTR